MPKPKPLGLLALIELAASLLEREADCLRESHTTPAGRWPRSSVVDRGAKASHDELLATAKGLRRAAKYLQHCRGGPAVVFDAVADQIRAGVPVEDAMRHYGLRWDTRGKR